MKKDFWLERWERQEIGFHQGEVNPYLVKYWPKVNPAGTGKVFVPLCGKSQDLIWLRNYGHEVLGVELSPIAVESFFTENGYSPATTSIANFQQCTAANLKLLCGDFFELTADILKDTIAVFDRASLVALPPEMRARYVSHLVEILPPSSKILLITFEYDQTLMSGPPFAVTKDEVYALYGTFAEIELLESISVLEDNPQFKSRGLTMLHENIFLLTLK